MSNGQNKSSISLASGEMPRTIFQGSPASAKKPPKNSSPNSVPSKTCSPQPSNSKANKRKILRPLPIKRCCPKSWPPLFSILPSMSTGKTSTSGDAMTKPPNHYSPNSNLIPLANASTARILLPAKATSPLQKKAQINPSQSGPSSAPSQIPSTIISS